MSTVTYIGLGSNLGDSKQLLADAVQQLKQFGAVKVSKLYRSPPMGPQDQPYYFNAVAQLVTALAPLALLDELQKIENESGRVRLRHWGERTLDLDLILYGEENIQNERLTVPHVGMMERDFVLVPLLDLDASLQVNGQQIKDSDVLKHTTLTVLADESWVNI
ncbi:2-amino-4-hydroxy-6-hydroxymethyldihydropteridine diphosphokinase [Acinetobacter shaoyimingii]|uniref:2-amino-4-hydroxy-6-hydroxymethyldihydropteridine pyrophosphokinase n=1 Tax=Acinetobacter shaoyimingii TaxID=2715164 RepID=A0A6G8RTK4_9GAMM|nr:2-amino-4-hydroxy-6-hydroxymethyldihydropteridine diphosphokinase [Acinetobacter shaoyimingii]QIO05043.1 2-amino-4-hydroxy-6-hydroxymethyldihydropteridine diphosphokinase [Acinetobacter shaoyimingii]